MGCARAFYFERIEKQIFFLEDCAVLVKTIFILNLIVYNMSLLIELMFPCV